MLRHWKQKVLFSFLDYLRPKINKENVNEMSSCVCWNKTKKSFNGVIDICTLLSTVF